MATGGIPGGQVEPGEAPAAVCAREVREELGPVWRPRRMPAHDWTPRDNGEGWILYVFDCGELGDETAITLQRLELDGWEWIAVDRLDDTMIPRLARRLPAAHAAYRERLRLQPGARRAAPGTE